MSSSVWDEDFLFFINYTIKVSDPAWFPKICGFQTSGALVQEENCCQAVFIQSLLFSFYLLFKAAVSSRFYSRELQLFDRQKPVTFFSFSHLIVTSEKYFHLKIRHLPLVGKFKTIAKISLRSKNLIRSFSEMKGSAEWPEKVPIAMA